jgi:cobalamin biosynthesis Mg chelatase CobN
MRYRGDVMTKIKQTLICLIALFSMISFMNLRVEGNNMNQVAVISVTKIGGVRNTNNLVVYLAKDYPDGSDQNQWGFEAAVNSEGIVVELGVNVRMPNGCKELASDCELDNVNSSLFHERVGFTEVNRIICYVMKIDEKK